MVSNISSESIYLFFLNFSPIILSMYILLLWNLGINGLKQFPIESTLSELTLIFSEELNCELS